MRNRSLFWGIVFIVVGGLFLLNNFAIISINIWKVIWPILLILLGAWVLWQTQYRKPSIETETASISSRGANEAKITMKHGAGKLRVKSGAAGDDLLNGTFGGGLEHHSTLEGARVDVTMKIPHQGLPNIALPWMGRAQQGLNWDIAINPQVPITLRVESGANDAYLDLSDLQIKRLILKTGASSTEIDLPTRANHTHVKVDAGVASVVLRVPDEVAARIEVDGGLLDAQIDTNRFPRTGNVYQSSDYDSAPQRIDIEINAGVGSVRVS